MRTARTNGTEENIFPKWSNTDFKLALDDTVKSIHCPEVRSSWNFFINSWMLFQYINQIPLSNTLLWLTASSFKMIQLRISEKIALLKP